MPPGSQLPWNTGPVFSYVASGRSPCSLGCLLATDTDSDNRFQK
jgi:hypothetical protein